MLEVKNADIIYYKPVSLAFCNKEMSRNPKNWWKLKKIASTDRERPQIFWKTWAISIKFFEETWFIIILKITKEQVFTLSLEDIFLEKPQGGSSDWPPSLFRVKQNITYFLPADPPVLGPIYMQSLNVNSM